MARALAPLGIRRAWVSPLGRAQQTARIHAEELGIEWETLEALREVSFGDFEGKTLPELEEAYPGMWQARRLDKWNYRPPGGESNRDAVERALEVVQRIVDLEEDAPRLIIAHFAINRIVIALLAEMEPELTMEMNVPHEVIYRVQKQGERWDVGYRYADGSDGMEFQSGWLVQEVSENQPEARGLSPTS